MKNAFLPLFYLLCVPLFLCAIDPKKPCADEEPSGAQAAAAAADSSEAEEASASAPITSINVASAPIQNVLKHCLDTVNDIPNELPKHLEKPLLEFIQQAASLEGVSQKDIESMVESGFQSLEESEEVLQITFNAHEQVVQSHLLSLDLIDSMQKKLRDVDITKTTAKKALMRLDEEIGRFIVTRNSSFEVEKKTMRRSMLLSCLHLNELIQNCRIWSEWVEKHTKNDVRLSHTFCPLIKQAKRLLQGALPKYKKTLTTICENYATRIEGQAPVIMKAAEECQRHIKALLEMAESQAGPAKIASEEPNNTDPAPQAAAATETPEETETYMANLSKLLAAMTANTSGNP